MEKTAVVFVDYEYSFTRRELTALNKNSYTLALEKAHSLELPVSIFSSSPEKEEDSTSFQGDLFSLLNAVEQKLSSYEHLIFFHSNMPLIDLALTKKIIDTHNDNIADYTFAEHYPPGFAPFMVSRATFKKIQLLSSGNNETYTYKSFEKLIHNDLNSYDVEIVIAPEDFRFIRDSFVLENERSFRLVEESSGHSFNAESLSSFFAANPSILRIMPSYVIIELCRKNNLKPVYFPYQSEIEDCIKASDFKKIMQSLKEWVKTGWVELSGFGEPFLNSEMKEILDILPQYPDFQFIIETNGILIKPYLEQIKSIPGLSVFFKLDVPDRESFKAFYGTDDFEKAEENLDLFLTQCPEKTFIAYTRMKANENWIESFLSRWRVYQDKIIINKFNDFCRLLP
ncbi:MAG: hypothetical protein A2Y41_10875, partial [Spirochaetes bacterium GWB1_36_13]